MSALKEIRIALGISVLLLLAAAAGLVGCGGEVSSPSDQSVPSLDGERINNFYSNEEIAYLLEIALWQDTSLRAPMIRRWRSDIVIGTKGNPTPEDLASLQQVAGELDGLARELSIRVDLSDTIQPNVVVYFVPRGAFAFIHPNYTYPDFGYTVLPQGVVIWKADVLVAIDSTSQSDRDRLMHRGLAASLGLANLSRSYPESVFYSTASTIPASAFAPIDRTIVELLYSSRLDAGMKRDDIIRLLANR